RARLAQRYRHVLVDELQDTSFAQGLLLRLLVSEHGGSDAFSADPPGGPPLPGGAPTKLRRCRGEVPAGDDMVTGRPERGDGAQARRWWSRSRTGSRRRWSPSPAARSCSGAARPTAPRSRPSRPTWSG